MAAQDAADDLRVVILNQYYVPDVASTGHLLHELAEHLSSHNGQVAVIASQPSYGPPETWQNCPRHRIENGIAVTRMRTTRFSKDNIVGRTINSLTFLLPLTVRLLFRRYRGEVYLYTTNPPYLGVIGAFISMVRRHPYVVLLHDSYPHLAVLVGKISERGIIAQFWHRLNRLMYGRANRSIVLCKAAKRLVCDTYHIPDERVRIVHNWADPDDLSPKPKRDSDFAKKHGLVEPFTVLYSGNLGLYYEFETILSAAEQLRDANFRLVFIGSGGKRHWIADQIHQRSLSNTLLLPYQPFETLNDSLNACDASLVTIQKGVEGISYPSKLYASLAVGRPIVAISEAHSELRDLVDEHGVGVWCALGDAGTLAERIRDMMAHPDECEAMGARARKLLIEQFTLSRSAEQYAEVLQQASPRVRTKT